MRLFHYFIFWLLLITGVSVLYSNRYSIINDNGLLMSSRNAVKGIEIQRSRDGHFYIPVKVNQREIVFLLDTGATDIVLSKSDAKRVAIKVDRNGRLKTYETANGKIKAAVVKIAKMKIGSYILKDIAATVSLSDNPSSVLGMSFLKYFDFAVKENTLVLFRKN